MDWRLPVVALCLALHAPLARAESNDEAVAREIQRVLKSRPVAQRGDPFAVATPVKKPEKTPARFSARPLRPPIEGYFFSDPKDAPPIRHVADLVCLGDAPMRQQWLAALEAAARAGKSAFDLGEGYGDWIHPCERDEACRFFAASARTAKTAAAREHLWELTEWGCARPTLADVFLAPATPDAVVVRWLSSFRHGTAFPEWNPRYGAALRGFARTVKIDPARIYDPTVMAAEAFASWDDPRALDSLLAVHAGMADRQRKTLLAIGMSVSRDPRAAGLWRAACKVNDSPDAGPPQGVDDQCRYRVPPDPVKPLAELVDSTDFDPLRWRDANPGREQELKTVLLACDDVRERAVLTCLEHLARLDWPAARKQAVLIATRLRAENPDQTAPFTTPLLSTLAKFESPEALLSWARERKLVGATVPRSPVLITELLAAAGLSVAIDDPEDGLSPDHAHLMRLISSAAPDLRGASFDQRKLQRPKSAPWKSYELIAFMDGVRWSVEAISEDNETYDLHIALAFANALLQHRKSPLRAALVADNDTFSGPWIAVLPQDTLRELVREGLIDAIRDPLQPQVEETEEETE